MTVSQKTFTLDDLIPRHAQRLGFGTTRNNMPSSAFDQVFGSIAHDRARPDTISEADLERYSGHTIIASTPLDELGEDARKLTSRWHCDRKDWVTTAAECFTLLEDTVKRFKHMLLDLQRFIPPKLMVETVHDMAPLFQAALPTDYFIYALAQVIVWTGMKWLDISRDWTTRTLDTTRVITRDEAFEKLRKLLVDGLRPCFLYDKRVAIAYARATDTLMTFYVQRKRGSHGSQLSTVDFETLFKTDFAPKLHALMLLVDSLHDDALDLDQSPLLLDMQPDVPEPPSVMRIVELGMDKLALLMGKRLYSMIVEGEIENNEDLMLDYREIAATPAARNKMSSYLRKELDDKLLQPDVSTVEIIDVYVQMVNALREIDSSHVLLERVSTHIREFLDTRDDAVRIIVSSLLDPGIDNSNGDARPLPSREQYSGQVGKLMQECVEKESKFESDMSSWPGKDLDDMNWMPEPIDAGPTYHKSKHLDAMGHMVTLKPITEFADELKTILQERLLHSDALHLEQEERLVAMFQLRLTNLKIIECEIMLKDMEHSRAFHNRLLPASDFQAKILSKAYWPEAEHSEFEVPTTMKDLHTQFETKYQYVKPARKLEWHPSWGRVEVELELEDRSFKEEVTAAQAAIIYQFGDSTDTNNMEEDQPTRSIDQLAEALSMDEDLVRSSLAFWVSKLILQEQPPSSSIYRVIESLSMLTSSTSSTTTPAEIQAAQAAATAAAVATEPAPVELKTGLDEMNEKKDLLQTFVHNMLTNQGEMPTARMLMMLRFVIPGGFPYEESEFVEFLNGLASEGVVVNAGGMWQAGASGA